MDENEYKQAYQRINSIPCVFEKALCSLFCSCSQGHLFRLADRHGAGCKSAVAQQDCAQLLDQLRKQTRFVFKISEIDGPLPHNKEIRVQNGGIGGLQKLVDPEHSAEQVVDVYQVVQDLREKYGAIDSVPFDIVMQSVMAYKARPKRRSR
ncbi:MAG: hypothetical protein ACN4GM_03525 [Gammaproteobacteria bacterium]